MKKSTTRFYSALLVCAMLAGLLPANAAAGEEPFAAQAGAAAAPGKGFRQPDAGKAQAEAAAEAGREVIEIDSADGLAAAIAGQQAGQTWKLAPGVYELTQAHLDLYAHWDAPGQGGWYFPLYADGLTLLGQGEVVVTTEVQSQNGVWATQDFVSVWGDGITIDGVDFGSKSEPNKAIEVMGKDFTLKNCTLLPVVHPDGENGEVFSGSIYFNPANEQADLGRCTLENVYLHAYISASAARAGVIDVRGVTMDARNNIWRVWGTGYGPGLVGSVYGQVEQVRYLVDEHAVLSDILDAGSAYAADTKPGTTIEFSAGTYRLNAPVTIGQDVALVGAGSDRTVFQAAAEPTVLIQVAGGDVDFSLSGIHVKGVEHNSHNNTSAVQVGSNGSPSTGNIEITACRFSGFTKNSVTIKGGKARIADNVIDCQPYPGAAGNGIQIDMGAQAVITGNTVNGYVSQTENWSACGMLVLRGGQITTVRDNTVTGCQTGIVKETYYDAEGDQTYLDPQAARNNVFVGCVRDVDFEFDLAAEIAAYTGGVIVLPCDVTLADRLTIDKDVVLDGSGFAIYGPGIDVTAGALTLRDVTLEGQESGGAAVLSINGADGGVTVSLSGVAVAGPADAAAIEITGGADVGMTGCVIRQAGRGVHIDRSGDGEAHAVTVSMRDTGITAQTDAVLIVDRPDAGCGVSVEIAGGSYTGAIRVENKAEASAVVITGGRFSADPTEYVASGYRVSVSGGMYVVSANTPGANTPRRGHPRRPRPAGSARAVRARDIRREHHRFHPGAAHGLGRHVPGRGRRRRAGQGGGQRAGSGGRKQHRARGRDRRRQR